MSNKKIFILYQCSYLVLFLQSMHVWFLWGNFFKIVCPLFFLIIAFFNRKVNSRYYQKYTSKGRVLFALIVLFIAITDTFDAGVLSICKSLVDILALLELTKLSRIAIVKLLRFLTKSFGVISMVSLVGWILFLVGVDLPNSYIVDEEFGYSFQNYYIFLYNMLGLLPRFCSVFLEPGYYGQLAAILLFANKMKLNNMYLIAIFLGNLLSLSLAGYILVVLGFIFTFANRISLLKISVFSIILFGTVVFFVNYNKGDNPVNNLIFARLEINDGKLAGDDRTTESLDIYLATTFLKSGKCLFGLGSSFTKMDWGHGVAGYKVYLIRNGFVGFLLAILGYIIMLFRYKKVSLSMKLCFILFMLMYWQAAYPYWFSFFSIYIFTLGVFSLETFSICRASKSKNLSCPNVKMDKSSPC